MTGTVEESGLFVTSINTLDNIRNIVGSGKIFGDITQNFRPIRICVSICSQSWTIPSMFTLPSPLSKPTWPRSLVLTDPAPDIEILGFLLPVPFWRCVRIAATRTTGRCTSTPTVAFATPEPTPDTSAPTALHRFASLLRRTILSWRNNT